MHLLACTRCRRPYDVTRLDPGAHVRCLCDEVLEVPHRAPLSVAALCCRHCGGGVAPDDPACTFCGRALAADDRRRATLCPFCFTRLDDRSKHCSQCGSDIRPQALAPLPAELVNGRGVPRGCPRCAGELMVRIVEGMDVIECAACAGLWFEPERFETVCREARRGGGVELFASSASAEVAEQGAQGYIPCLRCGELMLRRQFRHGGRGSGVVTDVCKDHGVWLDVTEVERIVAFLRTSVGADGSERAGPRPLTDAAFGASTLPRAEGASLSTLLGSIGDLFLDALF